MKSAISTLATGLAVFSLLSHVVDQVSARPSPKSSSKWMKDSRARGGLGGARKNPIRLRDTGASCSAPVAQSIVAPKSNVWAGLTDAEAASVISWLFSQKDLNLTTTDDAGEWDNTVTLVELMIPNKTDSLAYLDGNATAPARYAHVQLDHRATEEPYFQDILVGPLPIKNGTTRYEPLTYPYTRKTDGRVRNLEADSDSLSDWKHNVSASIADITLELFNGTATGLDNDTIDVWGQDPYWQEDGIVQWNQFWGLPTDGFDEGTLLPLGLYFAANFTGRDPSKWALLGWFYNDVFYSSTEEFKTAFYSEGFEKLKPNIGGSWAATDQKGPVLPLDTLSPPMAVTPQGSRYFVDTEQKYIKWMDFEFYVAFSRDTGMRIYNIKYKGKRIIYELGLQEALAHYAGNDPVQSGTSYLDTYYGFGPYSFQLVAGYDCPSYATYLNSSFYTAETTHTHVNSICLFESTADYPLQRHSTSDYVSVTKNTYFTIRSVATVGNYDYAFTYSFHLDGSVHVEVRASGYIQSAYWANNEDYGFHIHDSLSGSMHDHVLNYKLDMDVLGTANTLTTTKLVPTTETYPWSFGTARNTMKLTRGQISNEDDGKLSWGDNSATMWAIVNTDAPNEFGENRGYRIMPATAPMHLTVQNSTNLAKAAQWATHDFFVTRQKDTEPRSAHPANSQDVHDPIVDFDAFFDGESLEQEDLVLWFNLGMHHVPHTGDLPNTVFTTAHSGLQILPLNYLPGDPSRETVNMVRVDYSGGPNATTVETFGQLLPTCAVDLAEYEPDLHSYTGDVVIRKFPFDPNDPYLETDSIV
ncbi:membrane copper amine oxidase [Phyllosticta capitalensis]